MTRIGALILAGGQGERMRAAGPKPLVAIHGATLLERNLCAVIRSGLHEIWIAHAADHHTVRVEIERLAAAAGQRGVTVRPICEQRPLGTIGAARHIDVDALLTVNADNLTALELDALLDDHLVRGADLTLATHDHVTRLPYGAVVCERDRVVGYREKPAITTAIASAVCVLGRAAVEAIGDRERLGLPELTARLLDRGRVVHAFHHAAPWIDLNEPADIARATALVDEHADAFECWARRPDLAVVGALLRDRDQLLLEFRRDRPEWDTPGGKLERGETPAAALVRELDEELGARVAAGPQIACFDTLEPDGVIVRHHVFAPTFARADVRAREGQTLEWFHLDRLPTARARVVDRSLSRAKGAR